MINIVITTPKMPIRSIFDPGYDCTRRFVIPIIRDKHTDTSFSSVNPAALGVKSEEGIVEHMRGCKGPNYYKGSLHIRNKEESNGSRFVKNISRFLKKE